MSMGAVVPAGTMAATVMVVSGSCKDAISSQGIAANALDVTTAANGVASQSLLDFMQPPVGGEACSLSSTVQTDCPCSDKAGARKPGTLAEREAQALGTWQMFV
jgi:hypothetical protein